MSVGSHAQDLGVKLLGAFHIMAMEDDMFDPTDPYHLSVLPTLWCHPLVGQRLAFELCQTSTLGSGGAPVRRRPMRGIFSTGCAPAASGSVSRPMARAAANVARKIIMPQLPCAD